MARIVFEIEIQAAPKEILQALDTQQGIAGWWTEDVAFPGGVGSTMTLGFPAAPAPFHLRVDEAGMRRVRWTSVGDFPPHWAGTTLTWTLTPESEGTVVHFAHDGWASDDGPFPSAALTWGQLMASLAQYVQTGQGTPLSRQG